MTYIQPLSVSCEIGSAISTVRILKATDQEIEIIHGLLEDIMSFEAAMNKACDICAELDCLLSFAEASRAYDYRRPELTEENILIIKGGRQVARRSSLSCVALMTAVVDIRFRKS